MSRFHWLTAQDPGEIDGDPYDVADEALTQLSNTAREVQTLASHTRTQVRNAGMTAIMDRALNEKPDAIDVVAELDADPLTTSLDRMQKAAGFLGAAVHDVQRKLDEL